MAEMEIDSKVSNSNQETLEADTFVQGFLLSRLF
jgi:hypothetical protein